MGDHDAPTDEFDPPLNGGRATALAEPELIAAGHRLGGRYVLERRLGAGGMSVVWLATDERLDRPVAIKILSDTLTADGEYIGRFRREAKVAASLQQANLVPVYDYGSGDRPYLVMEYIEGGDLATRLERGDVPDPERLARELLAALRHIHGARVLHRDIKPQNVLIDEHGHARLTDFGIAQPRDADSLTRTGHVIGTEAFIAPEVKMGEPASERSDLYALGVLLADVAREGAGTPLWTLTDRLRAREADLRPASAAEALAELERATSTAPPGAPTQPYEVGGFRGPFEPTPTGGRGAPALVAPGPRDSGRRGAGGDHRDRGSRLRRRGAAVRRGGAEARRRRRRAASKPGRSRAERRGLRRPGERARHDDRRRGGIIRAAGLGAAAHRRVRPQRPGLRAGQRRPLRRGRPGAPEGGRPAAGLGRRADLQLRALQPRDGAGRAPAATTRPFRCSRSG